MLEQNSEQQLQRLAAQRQLYATAKSVFAFQVLLAGPIAVASALLAFYYPSTKVFVAIWGLLVILADIFFMTPWQKQLKRSAAMIQELFDCKAMELPWNNIKLGKKPDYELVKEQSDKYQKHAAKMPALTDWYPPVVDDLPIYIGRIACQRANCRWDSEQKKRYAFFIVSLGSLVFAILLGLSVAAGFSLEDFILKVTTPFAPAFALGIRQYKEQMKSAVRSNSLQECCEQLWKDALSGIPEDELTTQSRKIQDEIFEHRQQCTSVFDFVYKWFQPKNEQLMNFGIEALVREAKQSESLK